MTLAEALREIAEQIINSIISKMFNPLTLLCVIANKGTYAPTMSTYSKQVKKNCDTVRGVIMNYVLRRKSGEIKSQVADESDLLSCFMKSPDIFTDEFIVDEIMDFFLAGTATTQYAMQTIISYFSKNPDGLQKVR